MRFGGEAAGESASSASAEPVDCPSLTFSSRGAKRTLPFSFPCGQGSFATALAAGGRAAALIASPVGDPPLCVSHGPSMYVRITL